MTPKKRNKALKLAWQKRQAIVNAVVTKPSTDEYRPITRMTCAELRKLRKETL